MTKVMKNYFEVEDVELVERVSYKFKKMYFRYGKIIAVAKGVIKWQLR